MSGSSSVLARRKRMEKAFIEVEVRRSIGTFLREANEAAEVFGKVVVARLRG